MNSKHPYFDVKIDLYRDWLNTVKEVFRGSGVELPEAVTDDELALAYFEQTAKSVEEAERQSVDNEQRLYAIQQKIIERLDDVIVPDIRKRTGYEGNQFHFQWVYQQGEHIVEHHSKYRIPL
ncbi:hypothetical protein [Paenibacillus xylaniclasticus]|uniref:hypothetical protein n=1 Tax=Paenibacillus xylaniclasticus TaxID=588083 RepID=UPI000FD82E8A|nr:MULTISPECIES: hypothetical protein [Paenibacillus]GFN31734.1 hypothetical protein PCURB6_19940 [Paenibacillus curdlanolyticus]